MSLKISLGQAWTSAMQALRQFLSWWHAELEEAWEDWQLRVSKTTGLRARIVFEDSQIRLVQVLAGRTAELGSLPRLATPSEAAKVISALLERHQPVLKLDIVLPAEAVLTRQIYLPAAAGHRIREAVGFQLERLMPLKAEAAYFGCAVVGHDEVRRRLLVKIAEIRRGWADELTEAALAASVRRVAVLAPGADSPAIEFLGRTQSREATHSGPERWLVWGAVGLALAVGLTASVQYHRDNIRLQAQVQSLKARAGAAEQLRDSLQARVDRIDFLVKRIDGLDDAAVIAELTRLLPADAWVFQFQVQGEQIQIAGFTKDASALSATLASSPMFQNVSLRSAVKAQGVDSERFDIAIRLKPAAHS